MSSIQKKRPAKLKESCDCCAVAKVRCDKDKPSCSRCCRKGFRCSYGYSQRAGRRNTVSRRTDTQTSSPSSSSPRTPSISSQQSPSPLCLSPNTSQDVNELESTCWSFSPPPASFHELPMAMPSLTWSDPFYPTQDFGDAFPTYGCIPPPALMPTATEATTSDIPPTVTTLFPRSACSVQPIPPDPNPSLYSDPVASPTSLSTASSLHSSDDSSLAQTDAVQDELANLTDFAETMERKFDAVVRRRIKYRDVHSPVEELDTPEASAGRRGHVPSPDLSEMAFYHSLAELRRRLKWLREDVGNMVSEQDSCA